MKFCDIFKKKETKPQLWVKLKKLDPNAKIPSYAHDGDVGMDMTAVAVEYDEKHDMYIYYTGLAFESNFNVGQFLFARSSNSKTEAYLTNGVGIADSAIYRGEIQFRFKNRDSIFTMQEIEGLKAYQTEFMDKIILWDGSKKTWNDSFFLAKNSAEEASKRVQEEILEQARKFNFAPYNIGDRVGQMVFANVPTVNIEVVDELSETSRGTGGFGSTGK